MSPYVLDEVNHGGPEAAQKRMEITQNIPVLAVDEEGTSLAEIIIKATIIPAKASTGVLHIAVATRHGIDFILTYISKYSEAEFSHSFCPEFKKRNTVILLKALNQTLNSDS